MPKRIKRTIDGEDYYLDKTQRFSTGIGYAGSKGYRVTRARDLYSMGQYASISEFIKERKQAKKTARFVKLLK